MIMIGFQIGSVFTNFLITFFAEAYELHSFILKILDISYIELLLLLFIDFKVLFFKLLF